MHPMFSGELAFLSNFFTLPEPILMYGKPYSTVEHAYQAAKAISKADRELIRRASTAGYAKKLGRNVNCRPDSEPNITFIQSVDGKNYARFYRLNAMNHCINVCSETQLELYYKFLQELAPRDILTQDYIGFPCAKEWLG